MSQTDLNRVREDLDTIKQAAGLELPFCNEDVRLNLWSALCGVLVTACALFTPWEYRLIVLIPVGLATLITASTARKIQQQRSQNPGRWREQRLAGIAVLVFLPLAIVYKLWERSLGMPREMIGAAVVFFFGVGLLIIALTNRKRLYYAGASIPMMAFGFSIPICSPRQVLIAVGICWITASLAAAAIQSWQLRTHGANHAAD